MRPTSLVALAGVLLTAAVSVAAPPSQADIAKATKPAIAAAHFGPAFTTAVCVSADGYFVAPAAVAPPENAPLRVTLALFAGEKEQKVFRARVVRTDTAAGLTLLKVDADTPFTPVTLGDETKVSELDELLAFAFPYPKLFTIPANQTKPDYQTVVVAKLTVSTVQKEKQEVSAFVTDRPATHSLGGPALDAAGKLVGLVCDSKPSGVSGQLVPANAVRRFLATPVVTLTADAVDPAKKYDPTAIRVAVFALPDRPADETVELTVGSDGRERRVEMKRATAGYEVSVAPFEKGDRSPVTFEITFADGSVRGEVSDRPFTVGGKRVQLSAVRAVQFGKSAGAELADGSVAHGEVKGLEELPVTLGGKGMTISTATAREITIVRNSDLPGAYRLTAVVRRGGKEVGRAESLRFLTGTAPFGIDGMKHGLFTKPPTGNSAETFVVAVGRNDTGRDGDTVRYGPKKVKVSAPTGYGDPAVQLELNHPYTTDDEPRPNINHTVTTLVLTLPKRAKLGPCVYPTAVRGGYGRPADAAGLMLSGQVHPYDSGRGGFAIWELETTGTTVTKLAADVIVNDPKQKAPLLLSIRFNSTYK